jgi:hypothetical protein
VRTAGTGTTKREGQRAGSVLRGFLKSAIFFPAALPFRRGLRGQLLKLGHGPWPGALRGPPVVVAFCGLRFVAQLRQFRVEVLKGRVPLFEQVADQRLAAVFEDARLGQEQFNSILLFGHSACRPADTARRSRSSFQFVWTYQPCVAMQTIPSPTSVPNAGISERVGCEKNLLSGGAVVLHIGEQSSLAESAEKSRAWYPFPRCRDRRKPFSKVPESRKLTGIPLPNRQGLA